MTKIKIGDNMLKHKGSDFVAGIWDGVILNSQNLIELKENAVSGSYLSPEIETNKFSNLVASWNGEALQETDMEIMIQVRQEGLWSKWFSYGKWSCEKRASLKGQRDDIAVMDIDTVNILNGKYADGFRYKIMFRRKSLEYSSPKLRAMFAALRLNQGSENHEIRHDNWLRDLEVPVRSQMVIPEIGNIICSPTSLSMVMEYHGLKLPTEEVAAGVYDSGEDIYGNWTYNVAYAGYKGFNAYVERLYSSKDIKQYISKGMPVIASIRSKSKDDLVGAPMEYPSGHLLVVRGFAIQGGKEYIIVNDPAAPDCQTVRREYELSQFEKVWGGIVYIIEPA